ncbi:MAG: 3-deoxy-manno-octulosonate cytidylyltransferase, partial [Proteobacteria bacterium]|nr:3-deoxy-manno-octulosonate cytidylyltransferase [Pseudomonadota bacterium]
MTDIMHPARSGAAADPIRLIIAVPARLGSTRLPRKPLALLNGRPLILRVSERVQNCVTRLCAGFNLKINEVLAFVATDSTEIEQTLASNGILTVMTPSELTSGTDRILSGIEGLPDVQRLRITPDTLIINLQGDEPFFSMSDVESLVQTMLSSPDVPMGTLAFARNEPELFLRTSVVKVVCDRMNQALYFSRSPIPWPREILGASDSVLNLQNRTLSASKTPFLQHIGIYAYRMNALKKFAQLESRNLEQIEGLEQLRALEAGWKIKVINSDEPPFGIDTPEDLQRAEAHLSSQGT